jgi:predicted RNA-binding Zn-ribbon protein involved in translation (DUF1610 family)
MSNYLATFNCPGCGSPLEIQEGTISLSCSYCQLIMRVGSPGRILKYFYKSDLDDFAVKFAIERYLKKKGLRLEFEKLESRQFHLPFYRFRGMSYALLAEKIAGNDDDSEEQLTPLKKRVFHQKCRHFDLTIPGFNNKSFGLDSLGIRPGVMPLTAYHEEVFPQGSIQADVEVSPEEAREKAMAMFFFNLGFAAGNKECLSSEMIGEGLSVIYYPVWAYSIRQNDMPTTMFVDGLNKRVYHEIPGTFEYRASGLDRSKAEEMNPVQHKCPNCGFDLPTSESSLFYYCANCSRSYIIKDDNYMLTDLRCGNYEAERYFHPFWRFMLSTDNNIDTVGEFSKILTGEIPLIARSKVNNPFYLYVPAFRSTNLSTLTSVGIRLCRVQPEIEIKKRNFSRAAEMVLPEGEAIELARFYWNVIRSKYRYLSGSEFDFDSCRLGQAEIIWLSLSRSYGQSKKTRMKTAQLYA